jgi:hypothetical protein
MFRSTLRKFDAVYGYHPDLVVAGFYTYKFRPLHTQIQLSFLVRGFSPSEGFGPAWESTYKATISGR